ncbi:MAG: peptidoglycan-binding domain-containing protein [Acidobacteria bacterium]|nr:peptidoglycan-binding domain-containing protein [Acidobacteriota bacterium]
MQRLQEWLNIRGFGVVVDSDFGPVTAQAVGRFQASVRLPTTGRLDDATFGELVAPMVRTLRHPRRGRATLGAMIVAAGNRHLREHQIETGGQNCGPWVRLYMKGNDGATWAWCAGFVGFLLEQARQKLERPMPIAGSFSCDSLAAQAKDTGLFVGERDVMRGAIPAGSFFLVRRSATDRTHAGVVTRSGPDAFDTIEGNTNDDGSREGFEVCARTRGYKDKDFIVWNAA